METYAAAALAVQRRRSSNGTAHDGIPPGARVRPDARSARRLRVARATVPAIAIAVLITIAANAATNRDGNPSAVARVSESVSRNKIAA
jgi:hypothetical protein